MLADSKNCHVLCFLLFNRIQRLYVIYDTLIGIIYIHLNLYCGSVLYLQKKMLIYIIDY